MALTSAERQARYRARIKVERPDEYRARVKRSNRAFYYKDVEASRERARAYYRECFEKNSGVRGARQRAAALRGYHSEHRAKYPVQHLIRAAKSRAKKWGFDFDLTREWMEVRYTGRCELTGIAFDFKRGRPTAFSPSLDRIDNSQGYTRENCRFVLWAVNRFKNNDTEEDMMRIARALVERSAA